MITSCIRSTIYFFMTKIIARKTIAKKEILVPVCERSSWWNNSFEIFLFVLVRRIGFFLVIISFHVVSFIIGGPFENISIDFRIFFILFSRWHCDFNACISLGGIFFIDVAEDFLDEW
jgi:hypothetical protein